MEEPAGGVHPGQVVVIAGIGLISAGRERERNKEKIKKLLGEVEQLEKEIDGKERELSGK
jgi:hypothetical protein